MKSSTDATTEQSAMEGVTTIVIVVVVVALLLVMGLGGAIFVAVLCLKQTKSSSSKTREDSHQRRSKSAKGDAYAHGRKITVKNEAYGNHSGGQEEVPKREEEVGEEGGRRRAVVTVRNDNYCHAGAMREERDGGIKCLKNEAYGRVGKERGDKGLEGENMSTRNEAGEERWRVERRNEAHDSVDRRGGEREAEDQVLHVSLVRNKAYGHVGRSEETDEGWV